MLNRLTWLSADATETLRRSSPLVRSRLGQCRAEGPAEGGPEGATLAQPEPGDVGRPDDQHGAAALPPRECEQMVASTLRALGHRDDLDGERPGGDIPKRPSSARWPAAVAPRCPVRDGQCCRGRSPGTSPARGEIEVPPPIVGPRPALVRTRYASWAAGAEFPVRREGALSAASCRAPAGPRERSRVRCRLRRPYRRKGRSTSRA